MDNLSFDWYSKVKSEENLTQGDILLDFPILIPNSQLFNNSQEDHIEEIESETSDVIVLSQACDLENYSTEDLIVFCPIYELKKSSIMNKKDKWKPLITNRILNIFMLNKCEIENHEFDFTFADLKKVITTPYKFAEEFSQKEEYRIRLLPPYREALSSAFAYQFMRVGLPIPLPRKYPY